MQPYQQRMLDQMNKGFKPGELMLYSAVAVQQTGKSNISQWYDVWRRNSVSYTIEAQAMVDDEQWYTVRINKLDMLNWLRDQNSDHFDIHLTGHPYVTLADIHEQLYMMMVLRWGQ